MKHGSIDFLQSQYSSGYQSSESIPKRRKMQMLASVFWDAHWLPLERKSNQQRIVYGIISIFEGRNREKTFQNEEEKWLFY